MRGAATRHALGPLVFAALIGCAHAPALPAAKAPAAAPPLRHLTSANPPAVLVAQSTPAVAAFRAVFQRSLARAGFRIATATGDGVLTIALIGTGSGTSGSHAAPWGGAAAYVVQLDKMDVTVSRKGMLGEELKSRVSYTVVQRQGESFQAFNARAADAVDHAYEYLADDLVNQLVAGLPKLSADAAHR